jgi:hypothetical protein
MYHGQGTYTYPDGEDYVGEWKDGDEHGTGVITHGGGTQLMGEFKEGAPWSGINTVYDSKGNVLSASTYVRGYVVEEDDEVSH